MTSGTSRGAGCLSYSRTVIFGGSAALMMLGLRFPSLSSESASPPRELCSRSLCSRSLCSHAQRSFRWCKLELTEPWLHFQQLRKSLPHLPAVLLPWRTRENRGESGGLPGVNEKGIRHPEMSLCFPGKSQCRIPEYLIRLLN